MKRVTDLIGKRYGRLTVKKVVVGLDGRSRWECLCDCGKETIVPTSSLKSGDTKSCGCLATETWTTHGKRKTKEYRIWSGIKTRCTNPNREDYILYGQRGIGICSEWLNSFETFYADMGQRPSHKHTVDRIDNNKGYSKENCRWATIDVQARNRRNNIITNIYGVTYKSVVDLEKAFGIKKSTIFSRIRLGKVGEELILPTKRSMSKEE